MKTEYQYIEQVSEGCSLQYKGKVYRVQNDKGWLFIFVTIDGKRKKIGIDKVQVWFEYGSFPDWVFNEWWRVYPDFETFRTFATSERLAAYK
jgi:hypothetical protein